MSGILEWFLKSENSRQQIRQLDTILRAFSDSGIDVKEGDIHGQATMSS